MDLQRRKILKYNPNLRILSNVTNFNLCIMPAIRRRDKILYPELSYLVCGLCFEIHNKLGPFRNEKQYGDALESLLKTNNFSYTRESVLPISFNGEENRRNITDFVIDDKIILEIKAKNMLTRNDYYQIKRYLISAKKELGIIVNFRRKTLQPKRILNHLEFW